MLIAAGLCLYFIPLKALAGLSLHNELYSHFLLIPVVSGYFIWVTRQKIMREVAPAYWPGGFLLLSSLIIFGGGQLLNRNLVLNDQLFVMMTGFFAWIMGSFITAYGLSAFRRALFPMLFLAFMIPIPTVILDPLIYWLQVGSAHMTQVLFEITGVPYFRSGLIFELPGIAIEVAKECSGIRSTLALFITSVMAGYLFLDKGFSRTALFLAVLPITIFKNAVRITTITLLAVYVDETFLTQGFLHRSGGIFFFLLALCVMAPILWLLHRSEKNKGIAQKLGTKSGLNIG